MPTEFMLPPRPSACRTRTVAPLHPSTITQDAGFGIKKFKET